MALPQPISISQQADQIRSVMADFTDARGGYTKVMANQRHLWEELVDPNANKPRILVLFSKEVPRGSFEFQDQLYRVDRHWMVIVVRGHGFKNEMIDGTEPFLDVLETLREKLRCIISISEEFPINYRGISPLPNIAQSQTANVFLDASVIEFTTANDIPQIYETNPNPIPEQA